jgi:hypothetical protein
MTAATPPSLEPHRTNLYKKILNLAFLALTLFYWLFVYVAERVNAAEALGDANLLAQFFSEFILLEPLRDPVYFVLGMFHWRVLRHFIPIIVGWLAAYGLVVNAVRFFYDLPDTGTARRTIGRLKDWERPHAHPETLNLNNFAEKEQDSHLLRVGGPGRVEVAIGCAIVTEINGKYKQTLGAGKHSLVRFERVVAMLDLRLQERTQTDIQAMTRDGIALKTEMTITFRIKRSDEPPTKANPFPFDKTAARQAAYAQTALSGGAVSDWQAYTLTTAVSKLKDYIASELLDNLFNLEQDTELYEAMRRYVLTEANNMLSRNGVTLETARIGQLEVMEAAVIQQRIRYWQTLRNTAWLLTLAEGKAEAVGAAELARAEAEATMIEAIVEAIEQARREGRPGTAREIVALRLVESLERMTEQNENLTPIAANLQRQLQAINQQLSLTAAPPNQNA